MSAMHGGACKSGGQEIGAMACAASLVWPIGTLIFGPTCIGMAVACNT